jgi:sarcosine oxidase subunit alpha
LPVARIVGDVSHVAGGAAAGLAAARPAATTDARVIVVEQQPGFGGRARWTDCTIDGKSASAWADETVIKLRKRQDTTVLNRTAAISYHDHNAVVLLERVEGDKPSSRLRLWQVRAGRVILATGATERPLVFHGNDRPGVMLSSAVQEYIRHFAVRPADRAVVFTNNDDSYSTAEAIAGTGAHVTLVDTRSNPSPAAKTLSVRGIEVIYNGAIVAVRETSAITAVEVREASARTRAIPCDLVAMSGGFNPNTQLHRQSGGRVVFDETQTISSFAICAGGDACWWVCRNIRPCKYPVREPRGMRARNLNWPYIGIAPTSFGNHRAMLAHRWRQGQGFR